MLFKKIYVTGHMLSWLTLAAEKEELDERYIKGTSLRDMRTFV